MALVKEYFELTKKYQAEYGENTILLMQVGAFFEVYGMYDISTDTIKCSKIVDFSQVCELNVVNKNMGDVKMAGFKDFMIDKYVKKLQEAGYTIVVYVQDDASKNTTRNLAGIFSPGTYFQSDSQKLTNNITCIWVNYIENKIILKGKYVVVGVANIDIYTGKVSMFQFKEIYINTPTTYDELERFVSIYSPSEVILISNLQNEKELDYIINYAGITCNLIHKIHVNDDLTCDNAEEKITKMTKVKNCEKQPYQKEILSRFYDFHDYDVFIQNFYENTIATQAFCYLLDFVYQHNPHLVNKLAEPVFENFSPRLILANHSLKQLNIINDGNTVASKHSCVSQLLNDCQTPMGKRKFLYNLLNPICDETYLQREYNIIEYYLTKIDNFNESFKFNLKDIKDMAKFERQIFLKKISPKSIYTLYNNISIIKNIYFIIKQDSILMDYFQCFEKDILNIDTFCENMLTYIDININIDLAKDIDQSQNFEVNFIKYGIDEELDKKTDVLRGSELKLEEIRNYLSGLIEFKEKKTVKSNDYVKIHETEKNHFSLISTSRRCKLLQDALPNDPTSVVSLSFIKDQTTYSFDLKASKNQFKFEKQSTSNNFIVDEQINDLCKTINNSKISMKDMITIAYNKIVKKLESFQPIIESLINFITLLDILHTKSSIAKKYNYCKPIIEHSATKSFVDAKQLRHCLIEQFQLNELYVTNDITLGNGGIDGMLLYGTNAVGKTCFIKALGISIIMAQAGLYVPCTSFHYKPYKYLFTRIIGNDNIFKGLSTFAVEMTELRTILRLTNENSLILGDELCSGTETLSAISIFVSGIQHLYKCKSSFIFATHLHEIVDFEEITSLTSVVLKHMAVIYDKENDILVYDRKLKDGPGTNMYGLEVCKSLSLPLEFLENAYNIRKKYAPQTDSMLSLKTSHYNSNKLISSCEKCGKNDVKMETHHLQQQSNANDKGFISTEDSVFHKNNIANLMTLCETCHHEIHKKSAMTKNGLKRVKTTKGVIIA